MPNRKGERMKEKKILNKISVKTIKTFNTTEWMDKTKENSSTHINAKQIAIVTPRSRIANTSHHLHSTFFPLSLLFFSLLNDNEPKSATIKREQEKLSNENDHRSSSKRTPKTTTAKYLCAPKIFKLHGMRWVRYVKVTQCRSSTFCDNVFRVGGHRPIQSYLKRFALEIQQNTYSQNLVISSNGWWCSEVSAGAQQTAQQ